MAVETLENLITAIHNADGMLATASPEDSIIIQADIAEMVARIKEKYPDYKPDAVADISRENLELQLQTQTVDTAEQGIDALNQFVTNDTGQVVNQEALAEQEIITEDPKPTGHKILAELGEGRFVYELANGTRIYLDQKAGLSTQNPDMVEAALAHFEQGEAYTGDTVEDVSKKQWFEDIIMMDEGQARLDKFMSDWLFIGKGFDETAEYIGNFLGKDGERIAADMKLRIKAMEEARPGEAMALGMGGAIVSAIPAMVSLPATFYTWMSTLPWFWGTVTSAGASGTFNLTEGFISGWLDGEEGRRTEEGISRGMMQGMVGLATGPLSVFTPKVIAISYNRIKNGVIKSSIPEIMKSFSISKNAASILKKAVEQGGDSLDVVLKKLGLGGSQTMMADAGIAIQALTDAIATSGAQATQIIQGAVTKRAETVAGGVDKFLDKTISKLPFLKGTTKKEIKEGEAIKADTYQISKDLAQGTATKRGEAYTKAYNFKVNYHNDEGKAVMDVLNRMPPDLMRRALKEANDLLKMEGKKTFQTTAEIGKDGIIKWVKQPNFMQLDYIKRALSEVAYGDPGVPVQKGLGFTASALSKQALKMRYQLNEALKKMNPAYRDAVQLGQDKITRQNALEIGEMAMDTNMKPAQLARLLNDKNIGEAERKMVMLGFRANLDFKLGNVKAVATKGEDVQAMQKLWKDLSSKNAKSKLRLLVPNKKEFNALMKNIRKIRAALDLQNAVNLNSKTHVRGVIDKQIEQQLDKGVVKQLGQFELKEAARQAIDKAIRSQKMNDDTKAIVMKELAQIMTELKPATKEVLGKAGEATGVFTKVNARQAYKDLYLAVKNDNVSREQLQRITTIMFERLRMIPTIIGTQIYKTYTESEGK